MLCNFNVGRCGVAGLPLEHLIRQRILSTKTIGHWSIVRFDVMFQSKWVKDNGYGGVYIWDLAQDDFLNTCHQGSFPLLNAVFEALEGSRLPARQPSTSTLARTRTIAYTQAPSTVAVVSSAPRTTTTRSTTAAVVVATPARHHLSHGKSTTTRGPTENVSPFAGKPVLPKLSLGKKGWLVIVWLSTRNYSLKQWNVYVVAAYHKIILQFEDEILRLPCCSCFCCRVRHSLSADEQPI